MKAARLVGPRDLRMIEVDIPRPGPGEVLFRVEGCGICGSNIPPWRGIDGMAYPLPPGSPGHEAWGVIEETGEVVTGLARGQRITALSYGSFGEYDVAAADAVVSLPPELAGSAVPGEPLACAENVARRAGVQEGDTVVIAGFGFLAALLLPLIRACLPAAIVVASRRASALELARQLGADAAVGWDGIEAHTGERTGGAGADVVIEATGEAAPLDFAGRLCRVRGRLVIAGFHQGARRSIDLQLWNWQGLDVINAHERDPAIYVRGMRDGVQHLADGTIRLDPLITHVLPLDEIDVAFRIADARPEGFFKAIVTMDGAV